jgi:hypothetical protein
VNSNCKTSMGGVGVRSKRILLPLTIAGMRRRNQPATVRGQETCAQRVFEGRTVTLDSPDQSSTYGPVTARSEDLRRALDPLCAGSLTPHHAVDPPMRRTGVARSFIFDRDQKVWHSKRMDETSR